MYVLSCESTADITKEHFEARDLKYIKYHFTLDGKEYLDDLGETIPFPEFYDAIKNGADARTSQINISEYVAYFEKFLEKGYDIVHVCLSSGITGAINSARNAAAILQERFPDRDIFVIDSLGASSGYGLLMDTAASKRDAGMSAKELAAWIEDNKLRLHHWFLSTDLSSYVKGGRISKAAAVFGGALQICPLLNMDDLGRLIPREKIRTKKRVLAEIVKRMEEHAEGGHDYCGKCYICQSNCYEDAKTVADSVEQLFPKLDGQVEINWVGTTIGSHTGPGTVALFFWGDERTR